MEISRTKQVFAAVVVAAAVCLAARAASAHHSTAMFDSTKVKVLSGTVKEFQWKNPHTWIQLEVRNGAAKEEWSIEAGSPNTLSRRGWRPTSLAPGMVVSVKVNPMKDGSPGGFFLAAKFPDGKTLGDWGE